MRNRTRPASPNSLKNNAKKWTKELLSEIRRAKKAKGAKRRVPVRYYDRYKKPDVQATLAAMYQHLCCYCESRIGVVDYPHIEHRRPKRRFPRTAFAWDNLHWACIQCNDAKGEKWDRKNPILDAVDDKVDDHLSYYAVYRTEKTKRGDTTIQHAKLNREGLLETRQGLLTDFIGLVHDIQLSTDASRRRVAKQILSRKCQGEHGSFFTYLRDLSFG